MARRSTLDCVSGPRRRRVGSRSRRWRDGAPRRHRRSAFDGDATTIGRRAGLLQGGPRALVRRRPARDRRGPDGVLRLPAHLRGLPGVPRRPRGHSAADGRGLAKSFPPSFSLLVTVLPLLTFVSFAAMTPGADYATATPSPRRESTSSVDTYPPPKASPPRRGRRGSINALLPPEREPAGDVLEARAQGLLLDDLVAGRVVARRRRGGRRLGGRRRRRRGVVGLGVLGGEVVHELRLPLEEAVLRGRGR